jgi:hypothetical protein
VWNWQDLFHSLACVLGKAIHILIPLHLARLSSAWTNWWIVSVRTERYVKGNSRLSERMETPTFEDVCRSIERGFLEAQWRSNETIRQVKVTSGGSLLILCPDAATAY